jgi:hypothetical protein
MSIQEITILVPVVIGLVGTFTTAGLSKRLAPIASVLVGIGLVMLFTKSYGITAILIGLFTGLSASGAYSGVKKIVTDK